jgi:hypothetical protein
VLVLSALIGVYRRPYILRSSQPENPSKTVWPPINADERGLEKIASNTGILTDPVELEDSYARICLINWRVLKSRTFVTGTHVRLTKTQPLAILLADVVFCVR